MVCALGELYFRHQGTNFVVRHIAFEFQAHFIFRVVQTIDLQTPSVRGTLRAVRLRGADQRAYRLYLPLSAGSTAQSVLAPTNPHRETFCLAPKLENSRSKGHPLSVDSLFSSLLGEGNFYPSTIPFAKSQRYTL